MKTYELVINEDEQSELEVDFVSLVDFPAIEKNFLKFDENKPLQFAKVDTERRIISGPAMLADTPIFRRDEATGEEYNVIFKAETIEKIAQKFFAKGFNKNFNLMHNPEAKLDNVTIFESFITDESRGIKAMVGFEDAPQGSWFISAKVNDDTTWQMIKDEKIKGFSVEGMFNYKREKMSIEEAYNQIVSILSCTNDN